MLALNAMDVSDHNALRRRQSGESLASLLIGMTLGLLVVTAGLQMLGVQWQHQRHLLQTHQLQQDLQAALDLMTQELMQAQGVPEAWQRRADAPCADAFCNSDGALRLGTRQIEWATDRNRNGQRENNECNGFRVQGGKLQHKTACQSPVWTDLSDTASLVLTDLGLAVDFQRQGPRAVRRVRLTLSGHPAGQPEHALQLLQTVQLRNDLPLAAQEACDRAAS